MDNQEIKKLFAKKGKPRIKGYRSCRCSEGHRHDSVMEAQYCDQLYLMKKAGEIAEIRTQVSYDLVVNGKKICGIRPDFLVTYPDGTEEIIEVKGFATEIWRLRWLLFEALYPELKKRVVGKGDLWR